MTSNKTIRTAEAVAEVAASAVAAAAVAVAAAAVAVDAVDAFGAVVGCAVDGRPCARGTDTVPISRSS